MVLLTPVVGLAIAGLAIAFAEGTGKPSSEVLFSGQSALGPLITNSTAAIPSECRRCSSSARHRPTACR